VRYIEYFHDHVQIAAMIFEGAWQPVDGLLSPDRRRTGHGISLNPAQQFAV
jgi:hypothetical protein